MAQLKSTNITGNLSVTGTVVVGKLLNIAGQDIQIPEYSTENNNQFLRIVNGKPTWATIPNAEDSSF